MQLWRGGFKGSLFILVIKLVHSGDSVLGDAFLEKKAVFRKAGHLAYFFQKPKGITFAALTGNLMWEGKN